MAVIGIHILQRFLMQNFNHICRKHLQLFAVSPVLHKHKLWLSDLLLRNYHLLPQAWPVDYSYLGIFSYFQNRILFRSTIDAKNYSMKIPKKENKNRQKSKAKMELTKEEMDQIVSVDEIHEKMSKVIERLKVDYVKNLSLRTGSGAIDTLRVEFEGVSHQLNEIAQVIHKSHHLVVINAVAMPKALPSILKSLDNSGMNLNPQQEGTSIYITLPVVTREHREQLSKSAKSFFLKSKDAIRALQVLFLRQANKQKMAFSEDLIFSVQQQIVAVADNYILQAEKMMASKKEELLGNKK